MRGRAAMLGRSVRVRRDLVPERMLRGRPHVPRVGDGNVRDRRRVVHRVHGHERRSLHQRDVYVRDEPGVRRRPALLGRHVHLRPDVVPDGVLLERERVHDAFADDVRLDGLVVSRV